MKKILFISIINICLLIFNSFSQQAPLFQWQKSLGGSNNEEVSSIKQTQDGGYIICGYTKSNDTDVSGNHDTATADCWIVKTDNTGNIQWQKCFGGSNDDRALSIIQDTDGNYVFAGWTNSNDYDVSGNHDTTGLIADAWVVKTDSAGNILWQKCLGGTLFDYAQSIQQTDVGIYAVAGWTTSNNGDVSGNHGNADFWMFMLDDSGNFLWQKCIGGSNNDYANDIKQTSDGGFLLSGATFSNDNDFTGNHNPTGNYPDMGVVKFDATLNMIWAQCFGGNKYDYGTTCIQTNDGGFLASGLTYSNNGNVSGNHDPSGLTSDSWTIKLSSTGILQWQKCLGGNSNEVTNQAIQTYNGNYVLGCGAWSNGGDVAGNHGSSEAWLVEIDSSGNFEWQRCLGGSLSEYGYSVIQTNDSGFAFAGFSQSVDGDATFNNGANDFWVVKLGNNNFTGVYDQEFSNSTFSIYPNPAEELLNISFFKSLLHYSIRDASGKIILTGKIKPGQINLDVSILSKGFYLIVLENEKQRMIYKFIKQ